MNGNFILDQFSHMTAVDTGQRDVFRAIGDLRSPFDGIETWPWIDAQLRASSVKLLESAGHDSWQENGGEDDGYNLTFRPDSVGAERVLSDIERNKGGLLWEDARGQCWAVRLRRRGPDRRIGIALPCGVHPGCDEVGDGCERNSRIVTPVAGIRLHRRAEQLLWLIHSQVMMQRSSLVVIPDLLLRTVVWGEGDWPKDWRRDLMQTLRSLTMIRSEILNLDRKGWQPRLGATSVLISDVEDGFLTRSTASHIPERCLICGTGRRHSHFLIGISHSFLGVLEKFGTDDGRSRRYNFDLTSKKKKVNGSEGEKTDRPPEPLSLLASVFGSAKWAGMSQDESRVLTAIFGEVTRRRGSKRPDTAAVQIGNRVPGKSAKSPVDCPFLSANDRYVAFNGNGFRPGCGYRIRGTTGTGWLSKCDFDTTPDSVLQSTREFLKCLKTLSTTHGLVVVGYLSNTNDWLDLGKLIDKSRSTNSWPFLSRVILRVYGPEDYLDRFKEFIRRAGRFSDEDSRGSESLEARIRASGMTHEALACELDVSRSFVTKLINGDKPWPVNLRERAEEVILTRASNAVMEDVGGHISSL